MAAAATCRWFCRCKARISSSVSRFAGCDRAGGAGDDGTAAAAPAAAGSAAVRLSPLSSLCFFLSFLRFLSFFFFLSFLCFFFSLLLCRLFLCFLSLRGGEREASSPLLLLLLPLLGDLERESRRGRRRRLSPGDALRLRLWCRRFRPDGASALRSDLDLVGDLRAAQWWLMSGSKLPSERAA